MVVSLYRRRVAATVIEWAKDDPSLVKEVIARLRAAGEIELDDLVYLDRIADRWISIAEGNRHRARSAHPRQSSGQVDTLGPGQLRCNPVQQIGAFVVQCVSPAGQHLFDIVLCSRPVEVESEFSEPLDFVGREP